MKHFWLDGAQQAVMDSATSTASNYGYIGLFDCGKAWKTRVKAMVGGEVEAADYLRVHNITGCCDYALNRTENVRIMAAIRVKPRQAMMMKLRHAGSTEGFVRDDPTGEYWGNMLMFEGCKARRRPYPRALGYWASREMMGSYLQGKPFGPTLSAVGDHGKGLDLAVARALVWYHASEWHRADTLVRAPRYELDGKNLEVVRIMRDDFDNGDESLAKTWRRDLLKEATSPHARKWMGLDAMTGIIVE